MERRIELSWDQRTGDVNVIRADGPEERELLGVVKEVEMLKVHKQGKVVLLKYHSERATFIDIATVYDVRVIRYVSSEEVTNNGDETE